MAQRSQRWNTNGTGDGPSLGYSIDDWRNLLTKVIAPGSDAIGAVLFGVDGELRVTTSGVNNSPLTLATGAALVYGFLYENDTAITNLTVATPVAGTTGGRVVLEADYSTQLVRVKIVTSNDGVSAIPALVQTPGTKWQVSLYTFTITVGGVITLADSRVGVQLRPHSIDIGAVTQATTPYIDFHSSGNNIDYDSRIIASGGSGVIGQGTVNILAAALQWANRGIVTFGGRQGDNPVQWHSSGTTNYTPSVVVVQFGAARTPFATSGTIAVTFPVAFTASPWVMAAPYGTSVSLARATAASLAGFSIDFTQASAVASSIPWLAIGTI